MSASASLPAKPRRTSLRLIGALSCVALLLAGLSYEVLQLRLVGSRAPNFTLTDQNGKPWTLSQERGLRAVALFFGYTHCPDVCPTTLAHLAEARRLLGASGANIRIAFVTVDARRDSAAVLKRYVALFDPTAVGLTGDASATGPVYSAYHVWHQSLPSQDRSAGYLVSHTSSVYLIDRSGNLRGIADWTDDAPTFAAKLKALT